MRIGLIAPPWVPVPPRRYGGTEVIVDVLARGFAALGHDVTLFATGDSACPVRRRWVHRHPPDPMNTTIAELRHVQAAYAQLADCDIIHDHTAAGPFWAATRRDRPPVVATIHGEFTPRCARCTARPRPGRGSRRSRTASARLRPTSRSLR